MLKKISVVGIIILISISPLFRGLLFNYEISFFLAIIALLIGVYFFDKIRNSEAININKWFLIFGLLLIGAYTLGFINAVNPRENMGALLQYTELLLVFIVLYDYFKDRKLEFIKAIMYPAVGVGFICAILGIESLTGIKLFFDVTVAGNGTRLESTLLYANTASLYFAVCVIFAMTLIRNANSIILKSILSGFGNVIALAFFLTGSRGGWLVGMGSFLLFLIIQPGGEKLKSVIRFICIMLPVFVISGKLNEATTVNNIINTNLWLIISFLLAFVLCLLFSLFFRYGLRDKAVSLPKGSGIIFILTIVIMIVIAFVLRNELIMILPAALGDRLANMTFYDINILYRLDHQIDALKIIKDNWLIGVGRGGWLALYHGVQSYHYSTSNAHNNYLEVFIESGILGFLSYAILICMGVFKSFVLFFKSRSTEFKVLYSGLLCGLLALAIHSAMDYDMSFISLNLLLWAILAVSAQKTSDAIPNNGKLTFRKTGSELFINGRAAKLFFIVICSLTFSINSIYFTAGMNQKYAMKYIAAKKYDFATLYYEEAFRLDPLNSAFTFELAKLYNFFAERGNNNEDKQLWLGKARSAAEKCVKDFKYYPFYVNLLVRTYLASGMPLDALENSENLVIYQKCNSENYELLAQSYLAASEYYIKNNDNVKAKELLEKCLEIDKNPYLRKSIITEPNWRNESTEVQQYKHSDKLILYLNEAKINLLKLEQN